MKPYIKAVVVSLALVVSGVLVSPSAQVQIQRGFSTAYNLTVQNLALFADGTAAAPSITFTSDTDTGIFKTASDSNTVDIAVAGFHRYSFASTDGLRLGADVSLQWTSTVNPTAGGDVKLFRDAANTIALKNAANQQFLRVYGGTSNYGQITAGAGAPEGVVTAVVGTLYLRTDGGAATTLYVKESGVGNTGWIAK